MKTVVIQIGNTDNKLSQQRWSEYVRDLVRLAAAFSKEVHFSGGSPTEAMWQNYCVIINCNTAEEVALIDQLPLLAARYQQESIAVTIGQTQFVEAMR